MKFLPLFLLLSICSTKLMAQESDTSSFPQGYRSITIGLSVDAVKDALWKESQFDYRGAPDVSLQDNGDRPLIVVKGRGHIQEGFFQFHEGRLYLITLQFDPRRLDYYTIQQDLMSKYGNPSDISPQGMVWERDDIRLSLEYPLTLKYLSQSVFDSFLADDKSLKGYEEISRENFLKDL